MPFEILFHRQIVKYFKCKCCAHATSHTGSLCTEEKPKALKRLNTAVRCFMYCTFTSFIYALAVGLPTLFVQNAYSFDLFNTKQLIILQDKSIYLVTGGASATNCTLNILALIW